MPLPSSATDEVTPTPIQDAPVQPGPRVRLESRWWRNADFAVLGIWISVVGFTLRYHEKWGDEAQAWLLARDLSLGTLWFKELRYEGSPGLWHTILWFAQRVFHAPYSSIGVIGMAFATAGVALMLFKAPFPQPLRWMLAFSYFMVYQYAVIARPYTLLPLLCFAAAIFFKDQKHPERLTLVLVLLSLLTIHGIIIAGGIGLAYLLDAIRKRETFNARLRQRYALCIGIMAVTFLFLFIILRPTPDVAEFAGRNDRLGQHWHPSKSAKLVSILSGAFMDYTLPSAVFLLLSAAWCRMRRALLPLAVPCALLIVLYVFIHGLSHHHGTLFVAAITGLWIAWPGKDEPQTRDQQRATKAMMALLACLFAVNIWDAAVSIRYEFLYPYCGADDAAKYLKTVGADKQQIFGYDYGMNAVQAHFDRNILANWLSTYYHEGLPLRGDTLDFGEIEAQHPEYLLFVVGNPERDLGPLNSLLNQSGYVLTHFSDGYLFFKRALMDRQVYVIYRRVH